MTENDEVLNEFLVESAELLDRAEQDLMLLEKGSATKETLASIFRSIHTIKGTAGFFGFDKLQGLTHIAENVLGKLRDGHLDASAHTVSVLLEVEDACRKMLAAIESTGRDGDDGYPKIIADLEAILAGIGVGVQPAPKSVAVFASPLKAPSSELKATPSPSPASEQGAAPVIATPMGSSPPPTVLATPMKAASATTQAENVPIPVVPAKTTVPSGVSTAGGTLEVAPLSVGVRAHPEDNQEREGAPKETVVLSASSNTIRVDVGQLEKLMNLVGELVLARNQILQLTANRDEPTFTAVSQRLNLIATELQEGVMKVRMQPIDNVWNKFPRVVRDLSLSTGKDVRIEMEGRDTELDRTIIEAIKDPLTHIVRNSVDHGIEPPEKRRAMGKPIQGRLFLRAYHEGGQVNIEISDDGAGIDIDRVRQKAIDRGLATPEQLAHASEREIVNLIFQPGFSTAEKVTSVSGRGVGMDVVKTNIEKIGGTVDIQNRSGQGMTLKIKIPLTLAIIPALIVTSGGDRYAIPQVSLLELVRLESEQMERSIEMIHGAPVYRLRGSLLPLVYLNKTLNVEREPLRSDDAISIVVLQADDRQFGVVVDEVNDTEEIVVKPLGKQLKGINVFAGATIMGDGRVALILDVLGLAQRANVVSAVQERGPKDHHGSTAKAMTERQSLLLLGGPDDGRLAVALDMVSRLEEIPLSSVERVGRSEVVQYRGEILPLTRLTQLLAERRRVPRKKKQTSLDDAEAKLHVVVVSRNGQNVGIVVDRILDIVEEQVNLKKTLPRIGVLGSAVIQGRVTEMLDVDSLLEGFFGRGPSLATAGGMS